MLGKMAQTIYFIDFALVYNFISGGGEIQSV